MQALRILITGAAKGIGLATAKRLAKHHHLGLFDVDLAALQSLQSSSKLHTKKRLLRKSRPSVIIGKMDVTQEQDWDDAIAQMQKQFGGIDVLINNAGVLVAGDLAQAKLSAQLKLLDINCKGVLIGCHKIMAAMPKNHESKYTKIINLSSASAIYGQNELAAYSASKFFVRGLTEALNLECQRANIKVVDVMPLWVATDMTEDKMVTSMSRLGIRLNADDVAKVLYNLSIAKNESLTKVHYPVGVPAKLLEAMAQIAPNNVVRWMNKKIAT